MRPGSGAASRVYSSQLSGQAATAPGSHPVSVAAVWSLEVRSQVSGKPRLGNSFDRRLWMRSASLCVFSVPMHRWNGKSPIVDPDRTVRLSSGIVATEWPNLERRSLHRDVPADCIDRSFRVFSREIPRSCCDVGNRSRAELLAAHAWLRCGDWLVGLYPLPSRIPPCSCLFVSGGHNHLIKFVLGCSLHSSRGAGRWLSLEHRLAMGAIGRVPYGIRSFPLDYGYSH